MKPLANRRRTAVLLAGAAVLLAVGIPLSTMAATRVAVATGMTGTTGTLRVTACVRPERAGLREYCVGEFTPDDGTPRDPAAAVTLVSAPGRRLLVHRDAAGHYSPGGAAAALGWSAVLFLGLAQIVLAAGCLPGRRNAAGGPHPAVRLAALLGAAVLISALGAAAASLAALL